MKFVNPNRVIDQSRFHSFHGLLVFWLFFAIMFDGYDVVVYGATVPSLIKEWGISDVLAGAIGSYTVIGTAVGAIAFGVLADKMGRKNVIIFTTVLFSLFMFLSGFAQGPVMFTVFRILAGVGLGGVMPNVIALATEFSPKYIRSAVVSFVFCGYSAGAIAAALTTRALLPIAGWEAVYWIEGLPLLLTPFFIKHLPESISFLLAKGDEEKVRQVLRRVNPSLDKTVSLQYEEVPFKEKGSPVVKLFEQKRAFSTCMFWVSCFSAFVLIYSMNTWLPRLMMQAGYDLSSSLVFTAVMQVGAIAGTLVFGPLVDKLGFKKVLVPLFFVGALSLSFIGFSNSTVLAPGLIAIVGAASVGVQNLSNAFVSQYYPVQMRSTALGSTMAFGRIGGIIAPTFVGFLLSLQLSPQYNFSAIAVAAVLGGLAMLFVQEKYGVHDHAGEQEKLDSEIKATH